MTELLAAEGYAQTVEKYHDLELRLTEIDKRADLKPDHLASVRRSYAMMMRQYADEIEIYERGRRADIA